MYALLLLVRNRQLLTRVPKGPPLPKQGWALTALHRGRFVILLIRRMICLGEGHILDTMNISFLGGHCGTLVRRK